MFTWDRNDEGTNPRLLMMINRRWGWFY